MAWALVAAAALGFVAHGPPALRPQLPALAIAASDNSGVGDSRFPDSSDYVPDRLFNASGESNKLLSSDWRPEVFRGKFPLARFLDSVSEKTPGLFLTGLIGAAANALSHHTPGINQLLWGFVGGTAVGTMLRAADTEAQTMKRAAPGILFAKLRLLRIGIVLYGAKLTWSAVLGIGWPASFLLDLYAVASTLVLGSLLGRALGLSESLSTLISTGAAICGASAVAAAQPMIDAEAHEVGAALGTVVYFGTIAMCLYPWLYKTVPMLAADPRLMGIYTGATVHEMSGVVQAGAAMGSSVAPVATVTKLLRVCFLEPWLFIIWNYRIGQPAGAADRPRKRFPWFALGLIGVCTANSLVPFGRGLTHWCTTLSAVFLASAMAGLGLDVDLAKVRGLGIKPLALASILWANLLVGGLLLGRLLVGLGL